MHSQRPTGSPAAWWVGLSAGLLNVNFLLEWLVPHHSAIAVTVVSDLAVSGRPGYWLFRLGDLLSSLLLLVLCVLAWRAASGRAWRLATAGLAVFAVSTLLAVVLPEHCAAAAQVACAASSDDRGWGDVVHDAISSAGTTCGVLSAAGYALALRRSRPGLAAAHLAAAVLAGGLGVAFIAAQTSGHLSWTGWPQRGQIVVLSTWFALVGASVRRPTRCSPTDRSPARMRA